MHSYCLFAEFNTLEKINDLCKNYGSLLYQKHNGETLMSECLMGSEWSKTAENI